MLDEELLAANASYADAFDASFEDARPVKKLAVLTCMDARVDPHAFLKLGLGDMNVVRNAGGRATDDAIRSLMVSTRLLGARKIAVIHHTNCGNGGSDDDIAAKLQDAGVADPPRPLHGNGPNAIAEDVAALKASDLFPEDVEVAGYLYDVDTGRLSQEA